MVLTIVQIQTGETGIIMAAQVKKRLDVTRQFVCLLIILFAGNVIADAGGANRTSPVGTTCDADGSCQSGFCDLGKCKEVDGQYGSVCVPAPLTTDGLRDGKLNSCGAYICADARCRSCNSDKQCQKEYGAAKCRSHVTRPGKRCGY